MKKKVKKVLKIALYPLVKIRDERRRKFLQELQATPKELASYLYHKCFGRELNWDNPTELNEKIRWMQFNTDTTLWTRLADKYLARFFVEEKGYADILVKLYGVWDKAADIDFNKLPDSFVIKTNHGCGEVILVQDKSKVDLEDIRLKMNKYLAEDFGLGNAELHYLGIPRKIIAEELLPITSSFSRSMVDYKFYCINGEPMVCGVFFDRNHHVTKTSYYDMNWERHPEWLRKDKRKTQGDVPCPATFERMKQACRDLCKDMPFCRLDFYEANGKLYFGEFTFTPAACSGGSLDKAFSVELGRQVVLPT